jgi:hypothetical protein
MGTEDVEVGVREAIALLSAESNLVESGAGDGGTLCRAGFLALRVRSNGELHSVFSTHRSLIIQGL